MLVAIIAILVILWFLGYSPISGITMPNIVLFTINTHLVTLWEILIFMAVVWAIGILPRILKIIASLLLLLWVVSVLGILTITGLPNILVIVMIIAFILSVSMD